MLPALQHIFAICWRKFTEICIDFITRNIQFVIFPVVVVIVVAAAVFLLDVVAAAENIVLKKDQAGQFKNTHRERGAKTQNRQRICCFLFRNIASAGVSHTDFVVPIYGIL